jgi:hypothetical protein
LILFIGWATLAFMLGEYRLYRLAGKDQSGDYSVYESARPLYDGKGCYILRYKKTDEYFLVCNGHFPQYLNSPDRVIFSCLVFSDSTWGGQALKGELSLGDDFFEKKSLVLKNAFGEKVIESRIGFGSLNQPFRHDTVRFVIPGR